MMNNSQNDREKKFSHPRMLTESEVKSLQKDAESSMQFMLGELAMKKKKDNKK